MPEDFGSTHVVYQGQHYELPGTLSREEALLRVRNLTNESAPKMQAGFGDSRDLNPTEQASLDAANEARSAEFRGQQWSEGAPDAQDYKKLLGGAAFAAAPALGAGALQAGVVGRGLAGAEGARQGYESGGIPGAIATGATTAALPLSVSTPMLTSAAGYDIGGWPGAAVGAATGYAGRAASLLRQLSRRAPDVAKGAVAGGIAGSVPVIGKGVEHGAQLGVMKALGQGGMGALWKHGKEMDIIGRLMKLFGVSADDAAAIVGKGAGAADEGFNMAGASTSTGASTGGGRDAIIAADRARRAARAEEAVARARGGVPAAPPAPPPSAVSTTLPPQTGRVPTGPAGSVDDLAAAAPAPAAPAAVPPPAAPGPAGPDLATLRGEIGSRRAGQQLGLDPGQIRRDAGPVLGETLGEASPVIPKKIWEGIVTKMKSLPPEARQAYVDAAKDAKSRAQIENLRRTLESLGMVVPVGAAGAVVNALAGMGDEGF